MKRRLALIWRATRSARPRHRAFSHNLEKRKIDKKKMHSGYSLPKLLQWIRIIPSHQLTSNRKTNKKKKLGKKKKDFEPFTTSHSYTSLLIVSIKRGIFQQYPYLFNVMGMGCKTSAFGGGGGKRRTTVFCGEEATRTTELDSGSCRLCYYCRSWRWRRQQRYRHIRQ